MKKIFAFLLVLSLCFGLLTATAAAAEQSLTDVPADAYYYDAVLWAVEKGITTGTGGSNFSPLMNCTRSQVVTFLWRAAGSPVPGSSEMIFTDVPADAYYYDAVLWAVEKGITTGTGGTSFSPLMDCSRSQIVTFLWRSQGSPEVSGVENPFTDVPAGQYYTDAVRWAVKNGITTGTAADKFSSNMICTRSQIVTFLYRCMGSSEESTALVIDSQPSNVECMAGTTVSFYLTVSGGTPDYTYRWWYDTDNIDPREMSEDDTWVSGWDSDEIFVFVYDTDFYDHLTVWCVVTDANGETVTSDKATVTEAGGPLVIDVQPENQMCIPGETITFPVWVSGGRGGYTYDWQYTNDSLDEYVSIAEEVPEWAVGFDTNELQLTLVDYHFVEKYAFRCVIKDGEGQSVTSDEVDVVKALYIAQQPESVFMHPNGGTHSFYVKADGETGPYRYQWQCRNNSTILEFTDIDEFTRAFCSGFNTDTLELDVYPTDFTRETKFRCVITSTRGEQVISDVVGFEKLLYIDQQPQDVTVEAGETAIFTVVAGGGDGSYTYQWEWTCEGEETYHKFTEEDWASGYDTPDLSVTVMDVDFSAGYSFRCVITDEKGQTVTSDPARPLERLDLQFRTQPADQEAIAGEWASFSVEVVGGLPSYFYQWMMRCDGMGMAVALDDTDAAWATGYNSPTLSVKLTQAQLSEGYRFFCVVSDEEGIGEIISDPAGLTERLHTSS